MPTTWANCLGRPATGFSGFPSIGIINRVARMPNGLRVGPVNTRAVNPYSKGISSQEMSKMTIVKPNTETIVATTRAAYSFTELGKLKMDLLQACSTGYRVG